MRPVVVKSGELLWSGEHWVNFLQEEGGGVARVSLFHTCVSPKGEGNAALIRIPGENGWNVICTDRRDVGDWIAGQFFRDTDYFDSTLPVLDAKFSRGGDIRDEPSWTIEAGGRRLVLIWKVREAPVVADGEFSAGQDFFTILYFTNEASMKLDGREVAGKPYMRDIWKPTIGGDRSSCLFALAETLVQNK